MLFKAFIASKIHVAIMAAMSWLFKNVVESWLVLSPTARAVETPAVPSTFELVDPIVEYDVPRFGGTVPTSSSDFYIPLAGLADTADATAGDDSDDVGVGVGVDSASALTLSWAAADDSEISPERFVTSFVFTMQLQIGRAHV